MKFPCRALVISYTMRAWHNWPMAITCLLDPLQARPTPPRGGSSLFEPNPSSRPSSLTSSLETRLTAMPMVQAVPGFSAALQTLAKYL